MKKAVTLTLSITILLLIGQTGFAQRPAAASDPRAVYGKVADHIYTNPVIGIKLQIPKEMEIDEPSYTDVALVPTQVPGSVFAGQTLTIKNLFSARAFPVTMIATATKLAPKNAKMTGEQVLNDRLWREPNGPMAKVETLGGNTFAYIDGKTRFNENRAYAIVRKGYYISIVLGYRDKGDLDIMREYLAAADFDWNGK